MILKGHNALWNVMSQAVSGHVSETMRDTAKVGYY